MSEALVVTSTSDLQPFGLLPWRDPHTVPPADLSQHIARLEQACLDNPRSADLRTCLGIAYAVGLDVYKSLDTLEAATELDPDHFWAQLKFGELQYRLRALREAETHTRKALNLASNPWQLAIARRQLQEIRRLLRESTRNVTWNKPLAAPVLVLVAMFAAVFAMMW